MPNLSKFSNIPSGNQNSNFLLPKPKVKDYSPIDWTQYFPNQEYLGDVKLNFIPFLTKYLRTLFEYIINSKLDSYLLERR